MKLKALVIDETDNVANLIGPGNKDQAVGCVVEKTGETTEVKLLNDIPPNHKLAFKDIPAGAIVVKYGMSIGKATRAIARGEHVHDHNIESNRGRGDLPVT